MATLSAAVEGPVDEAVLARLAEACGHELGPVYGKKGKDTLRQRISGYNAAARQSPWVVLVDLNASHSCAPELCTEWLPNPSEFMRLRVAVREIEAWLIADRSRLARFLSVSVGTVPAAPEAEDDPKRTMVNLAARSRRRDIRTDMVPRPGSGRNVGPAYTARLIEFVSSGDDPWSPADAAAHAESLRRCIAALETVDY